MTPQPAATDRAPATERDTLLPRIVEFHSEDGHALSTAMADRPRRLAYVSLLTFFLCFLLLCSVVVLRPASLSRGVYQQGYYGGLDVDQLKASSKKNKKKKHAKAACNDGSYSKRTLQRAYELPFAALFRDNRGQTKYEASSVIAVGSNVYAVCDSSWSISKFSEELVPFSNLNVQIGDPQREKEDSGYEALFHDNGTFYVVRESVNLADGKAESYHAIIEELDMGATDYTVVNACPSEFEFEGDSKGFEGAIAVHDVDGSLVVLGLCEGNFCSETRKNEVGNGRLVAMKKVLAEDGSCTWITIRKITLPPSANFRDYSAISIDDNGRVAVSSQEESQVWVGKMLGQSAGGTWDVNAIEFDADEGTIYDFPKNDSCETVYCNIEGIHWVSDNTLLAVSDKMKGKGKQDFRCFEKDQSVHVFVIP